MIYRVLRVLMSRHLVAHLLVPLLVGLAVETFIIYSHGNLPEWREFVKEKSSLILGVIITYMVIASYFIYNETSNQIERRQLDDLTDALSTAQNFFATNTLSLKEWFEPSTQIYFARIVKQQQLNNDFRHERVLLLFTSADAKNYKTPYLDEHYAKSLVEIHKTYNIDLAALERRDINEILSKLTSEEKKLLNLFPQWIKWCPDIIQNVYLRIRRRIPQLDFAFITHMDTTKTVFPFSKYGKSLRISSMKPENGRVINAYEKLMLLIKAKIYVTDSHPPKVASEHLFASKIDVL